MTLTFFAAKKAKCPGLHQERCQEVKGCDPSPLFCTGEDTPGVLGPVLGSPVQKTYGHA